MNHLQYYWHYREKNNNDIRKNILRWLKAGIPKRAIISNLKINFNKGEVSKANWKLLIAISDEQSEE